MAKLNTLKKEYLVTKLNVLNEMRANNMTMQELRLFSIYLSRINPEDVATRHVRFSIAEFQSIMELGRINIAYYKRVAESLLGKAIFIPTERGGFTGYTLFSEFKVDSDEYGEWHVNIDANEKVLPLLFDFKNHYFRYELWNALRLRGKNQLRMYEILKQYEKIGYRIVSLEDLRNWLGIEPNEYPQYKYFRQEVLEPCKKAIAENTDITFTYEPHSKRGRKIVGLIFHIEKNVNHKDPLSLREFIELNSDNVIDYDQLSHLNLDDIDPDEAMELQQEGKITRREELVVFLRDAVNREFTVKQMQILYDIAIHNLPSVQGADLYRHFQTKYNYMKEKESRGEVRVPFGYMKKIIGQSI